MCLQKFFNKRLPESDSIFLHLGKEWTNFLNQTRAFGSSKYSETADYLYSNLFRYSAGIEIINRREERSITSQRNDLKFAGTQPRSESLDLRAWMHFDGRCPQTLCKRGLYVMRFDPANPFVHQFAANGLWNKRLLEKRADDIQTTDA